MADRLANGSQDFDGLSLEEVYARLEATHGKAAAKVVAKFMGLPPKPYRRPPPERVGAKPVARPALPNVRSGGPDWKDLNELRRLEPPKESVRRFYVHRGRAVPCRECGHRLWADDEAAVMRLSGFRVHAACAAEILARDRTATTREDRMP